MSDRHIGPAGTTARFVGGLLLIVLPLVFDFPHRGVSWWDALAVFVAFPLLPLAGAAGLNAVYQRQGAEVVNRARDPWSAEQAGATVIVLLFVIGVATALTFVTPMNRLDIFVFFGLSMLLAAERGYGGCELLALPNLVLRRNDAIWCPLYTPVDRAERDQTP